MPFGKYSQTATRLADIPADYFFWLWENPKGPELFKRHGADPVANYIAEVWKRLCNEEPDYIPRRPPPRNTRTATRPPNE